jgi:hypothetical protein
LLSGRWLEFNWKQMIGCGPHKSFLILNNGQFADIVMMTDKHALALVSIVGSLYRGMRLLPLRGV